jgi:O-antigen/teichoic acid export membrane protein
MTEAIEHASPVRSARAIFALDAQPALPATGIRPAARRGVLALLDQAAVSGTALVTSVVVGRVAGPEELGLYSLGFAIMVLAICVQDSLVSAPYTVFVTRMTPASQARYAGSMLALAAMVAAVVAACLAIAGGVEAAGFGSLLSLPVVGAIGVAIPFVLLREFARRLAFAHLEMATALAVDGTIAVLQVVGLGLLAVSGLLSAMSTYAVIAAACGLAGIVWLVAHRDRFVADCRGMRRDWQQNWAFGRWILAAQSASVANNYLAQWLLAALLGAAATGGLAACMSVVAMANPLLLGVGNLLSPSAARAWSDRGAGRLGAVVARTTWLVGAAMVLICGVAVLFGDRIMGLLYGDQYAGLGSVLLVAAAAYLVSALSLAPSHGLFAMERSDWNFYASAAGVVVTLVAGTGLALAFGTIGAAGGFLAGNIAKTAATVLAYRRILSQGTEGPVATP